MLEYIVGYIGIAFIHFILSLIVIYFITKPTFYKYFPDTICCLKQLSGCLFEGTEGTRIALTNTALFSSVIWPLGFIMEIIIFGVSIIAFLFDNFSKITNTASSWFWGKIKER